MTPIFPLRPRTHEVAKVLSNGHSLRQALPISGNTFVCEHCDNKGSLSEMKQALCRHVWGLVPAANIVWG